MWGVAVVCAVVVVCWQGVGGPEIGGSVRSKISKREMCCGGSVL